MSYLTQSLLARDSDIESRVTACAAALRIEQPQAWAYAHAWELSARPGWVTAYQAVIDADSTDRPGADDVVGITDAMILAAGRGVG